MISIAIPIYNFDVSQLVVELKSQMDRSKDLVEIILIDDASEISFREKNKQLQGDKVQYIQLEKNVGRASIRNLFLKYVKYNHILFLDVDGEVEEKDFLSRYINAIKQGYDVVCGGRVYPIKPPEKEKILRWKYGVQNESKSVEDRQKNPHQSFMTNNFLVSRVILDEIRFNEGLKGYGHEDTLFGFQLMLRNIPIYHINNPVLNGDIETNEIFLSKTEEGILSLVQVLKMVNEKKKFISTVKILDFYTKNKWWMPFFKIYFRFRKNNWKSNLIMGDGSVKTFNLYKLGLLVEKINQ